jgi:hypothetical protein
MLFVQREPATSSFAGTRLFWGALSACRSEGPVAGLWPLRQACWCLAFIISKENATNGQFEIQTLRQAASKMRDLGSAPRNVLPALEAAHG